MVSLYKPRVQSKDVPHECVDEPVHREILACAHTLHDIEVRIHTYTQHKFFCILLYKIRNLSSYMCHQA